MKKNITLLFCAFISLALLALPSTSTAQLALEKKIEQIAGGINGRLGVYAQVLETGASVSYQGEDRYPMQSVYKFPIAMAVLDRVDKGGLSLDQVVQVDPSEYIPDNGHSPLRDKFPNGTSITVRQLLYYAVTESDGSASDVLLRLLGGTEKAQEYIRGLGIHDMAIATTEKVQVANDTIQYRNWTTPRAMSQLFSLFYTGNMLTPESKALLLKLLSPSGPWFDRRIKGLLPQGTPVFHKTGTSGTINGLTRATNDAGIITLPNGLHVALSVFIADSYAGQKERETAIAKISRAVFDDYADSARQDHVFFLHNRFIEDHGPEEAHPEFGKAHYREILEAFRKKGLVVHSEKRPPGTDAKAYAGRIARQIDSLIAAGVPPAHITVIGTSRGGYIAQYVSTRLANPDLNFVFIGCYQKTDLKQLSDINFCGNILTIYEASDTFGVSAVERKETSGLPVTRFQEIELHTNLKHGFLFRPLPEWIRPAALWAQQRYGEVALLPQANRPETDNLLKTRLDSAVQKAALAYMQYGNANGISIGVVFHGLKHTYNYGTVEKGSGKLPTAETYYNLGSVAKLFMGTMLAEAVIEHRAKLSDDIRKYLPASYPNLAYQGHPVRLVDLANHTSALPGQFHEFPAPVLDSIGKLDRAAQTNYFNGYNTDSLLADLHRIKPDTVPGFRFKYNGNAMLLLQFLIERIYHQSYEKVVTNYLEKHLGMDHTKTWLSDSEMKQLAQGYDRNNRPQRYVNYTGYTGGPSMNSTVDDMLTFLQDNMEEKDPALKLSHQITWGSAKGPAMGLAWMMDTDQEGRYIFHDGHTGIGFNTHCIFYPKQKLGLIIIVNDDVGQDKVWEMGEEIMADLGKH